MVRGVPVADRVSVIELALPLLTMPEVYQMPTQDGVFRALRPMSISRR
jgi:hypothetical protein